MQSNNFSYTKQSDQLRISANELYKKSMHDDALEMYYKAIALNPQDYRSYANIGLILINQSKYSEAKHALEGAIEFNPNYAKAYYRLGIAEKHLKNHKNALRNFETALRLEPGNKAIMKERDEIQSKAANDIVDASFSLSKSDIIKKLGSTDNKTDSLHKPDSLKKPQTEDSLTKIFMQSLNVTRTNGEKSPSNHRSTAKSSMKSCNEMIPCKIEIPVKIPETLPKSSYQFNLVWREFKDNRELKIKYLTFVGAHNFFTLFEKNIEPDFLSEIIALFSIMNEKQSIDFLTAIMRIKTFEFSIMFLSSEEKLAIRKLIENSPHISSDRQQLLARFKV